MPLQNRVRPNGDIIATSARGTFYGNRGGKIHDLETRLLHPSKRWASKQWICCALSFKGRRRPIMGVGYTELYFLDEVTALAAGHRPCFECRRKDALAFAEAWQAAYQLDSRPRANEMDTVLHKQRLEGRQKRTKQVLWSDLPNGVIVERDNQMLAKCKDRALLWTEFGYEKTIAVSKTELVEQLTPVAISDILKAKYSPNWHFSAGF